MSTDYNTEITDPFAHGFLVGQKHQLKAQLLLIFYVGLSPKDSPVIGAICVHILQR